jgi:hypothetical protein
MSSRHTSSGTKEDVVFPRMLYCDSRCSQTLQGLWPALPGTLLCIATRRQGDRRRGILRQRVQGSVRAVRAVRNTLVFQTETRVVADVSNKSIADHSIDPYRIDISPHSVLFPIEETTRCQNCSNESNIWSSKSIIYSSIIIARV